jgi:GTP-binding protein
MSHVPIAFITAKTGKNVKTTLNHAKMLFKQSQTRVATGRLNALLKQAVARHPPPLSSNHRRPKIFYATQASTQPPTIVLVCNDPKLFTPDYRRYLLNVMRDHLSFAEIPVRLLLRRRGRDDRRSDASPDFSRSV